MSIFEWHVDFDGSGGLVTAYDEKEAKEKVLDRYELSDFNKKHLQIKRHRQLNYQLLNEKGFLRTKYGNVQVKDEHVEF